MQPTYPASLFNMGSVHELGQLLSQWDLITNGSDDELAPRATPEL
jgi:hypothetical protein